MSAGTQAGGQAPRAETWRAELSRRPGFIVLLAGALYFAQGLPLGVAFGAYPTILRDSGAELSMLAALPLVALPWAFKFAWSPIVDNHWWARLGRRRTWLVSQQALIIATMLLAAAAPMNATQAPIHFLLFGLASLFSATQDIATDGLAAEKLEGKDLLRANTLAVAGMVAGTIVGGGGLLVLAGSIGVERGLLMLAALLVCCAGPVLVWREESGHDPARPRASLFALRRPGFWPVLLFAASYAAAHSAESALAKAALVDHGWTLASIGWLETATHGAMLALGCGAAAWAIRRLGVWSCVVAAQVLFALTSCAWLAYALGWIVYDGAIAAVRMAGGVGMGLASVACFTAMMRFAGGGRQAGTDVTAFKSANALCEIMFASLGTTIAAAAGYPWGFGFSAALAAVAIGAFVLAGCRKAREFT